MKDRRALLKDLAVGTAWVAPVISSVVLPVHAQTTQSNARILSVQIFTDGFGEEILGNPPEIAIGTAINFLITTNSPNTEFQFAVYKDGARVGENNFLTTQNDGRQGIFAMPQAPAGDETVVFTFNVDPLPGLLVDPRDLVPEEEYQIRVYRVF
ncbi:MAG: hypothetical protein AAF353_01955 [Pseudomonadota bacterium]